MFVFAVLSLAQIHGGPAAASTTFQTRDPKTQYASVPDGALTAGMVFSVELAKPLDAKKSKINEIIEAKTTTDLRARNMIVIPRHTKIIGHVTETTARSKR
jgi:hypothetical protein